MTWRFRKSFSPLPGVRITLSKSGITTSVGVGPARLSVGNGGVALNLAVPGAEISFQQPPPATSVTTGRSRKSVDEIDGCGTPQNWNSEAVPPASASWSSPTSASFAPIQAAPTMREIRSGSSSAMTSPGLVAFKASLMEAEVLYSVTSRALMEAKEIEQLRVNHYESWNRGWIFKRVAPKRFAQLQELALESVEKRKELDEQLLLSRLNTQFEMSDAVARSFGNVCRAFEACSRSQRVWDNVAQRATNRVAERTSASHIVDLKPVKFQLGKCAVIDAPMAVPHLENANGGDLFLYPGFMLYHAASTNYALVEFGDMELSAFSSRFQEHGPIPTDSEQVGTTWAKANKDGSPDRRFKDNYAIPVMRYGTLTLRSSSGLNEEYMLSDVAALTAFGEAFDRLRNAVLSGT